MPDMLPMLYAPQRGVELPQRVFAARLPLPDEREMWRQAALAAVAFWDQAGGDRRISAAFRQICAQNAGAVRRAASLSAAIGG